MEKQNPDVHDIYELGQWLERAERIESGQPWGMTRLCLKALCTYRHIRGLEVIGVEAESKRKELSRKYKGDNASIEEVDAELLELNVAEWRGRIEEISRHWVMTLPQTHMDIGKLIGGAKSFLEEKEWNMLQLLEQQGLNEATLCLLHNTFTSAEFIALRTAESLLRRWYQKKTGNKLERQMWGEILDELNELYPKKPERPKELSLLDYLRGRRNEIAHPEAISNPEEATATFLNVIAVCKAIKSELLR